MSQNDDDEFSVNEKNMTMLMLYIIKAWEVENGEVLTASHSTINQLMLENQEKGTTIPVLGIDFSLNNGTHSGLVLTYREPEAVELEEYAKIYGADKNDD